jgi:hypothetical protein
VHGASLLPLAAVSESLRSRDSAVSEREQDPGVTTTKEALVKKLIALAGAAVLSGLVAVLLVSCGSETASSPGPPSQETHTSTDPALRSDGSSPAELAGDGRYFGYARAVDSGSKPSTISFDVAQFFFGKDVQRAAEQDGAVPPGEPVPNDHYERNPDRRAEALKIASDAQVTAAVPVTRLTVPRDARDRCQSGCASGIPIKLADFFSSFEQKPDGRSAAGAPVWVTIRNGLVVRIDEQYFP